MTLFDVIHKFVNDQFKILLPVVYFIRTYITYKKKLIKTLSLLDCIKECIGFVPKYYELPDDIGRTFHNSSTIVLGSSVLIPPDTTIEYVNIIFKEDFRKYNNTFTAIEDPKKLHVFMLRSVMHLLHLKIGTKT